MNRWLVGSGIVSANLTFSQLADDNMTETGQS
ncbi:hypothetical protein FHT40_006284 [Mycolicibacterium sp. BK556]|nr:hypothetical protein [Mycolicibacterium sp. BK556]MBB3636160.1 hypothetical protein [Mycolicibacterium sp. BK607]MBB3753821.1 hypothetical protein [Mycolicibacterium sp. BK634]TDO06625.1 hypothetical protein EV580_6728 [Mycobacterium sp. BK086]